MAGDEAGPGGRNKTVFRPSPLQSLKQGRGGEGETAAPHGADWPDPAFGDAAVPRRDGSGRDGPGDHARQSRNHAPLSSPASVPSRLAEDDVPHPATPRSVRNLLLTEAGPVLALAAGMRAGRVRMPLPQFHRQASRAIAAFEAAVAPHFPQETRQRAKYALCATIDDIAQNLPGFGADGAEWARRSLVVKFFRENIGGDRFWQLVDDMLRYPADNRDLIELYHACLASGFEGRFRVMPDGRRRLHEIMSRLNGALDHVRSLSPVELSPQWRGEKAPLPRVGFWTYVAMAAGVAAAMLFLVYVVLRIILMNTGAAPARSVAAIVSDEPLRLSRAAPPMAQGESPQTSRLKKFLETEIRERLVRVEEDASTVRVRTTVGQLFKSGSDALEPGRQSLFERIGRAIEGEPGPVLVEGHADSDRVSSLSFPDNFALSAARADRVADIIRSTLTDAGRVTAKGMGDTTPIASNRTAAGKSLNRRVEIIVQRHE
ncbi:MAG: type IVB secretion system protein IcmH/DotU [Alphaproteobacteria bacterium]|nr:type IVB secretion system protein IcmH/DotU [Alphaproteobacteria bacterium]